MKVRLIILTFLISCTITNYAQQLTFQKTYGSTKSDDGKAIRQTTDGGYIIAGQIHTLTADSVNLYLIKTDVNGDTLWTRVLGDSLSDWANAVQQTTDGGYIVAGGTFSYGANNELIFINKFDATGNLSWSKAIGGSNINDAYNVRQTTDGGYIICGVTLSYGAGGGDLYLIKTNSNGDTTWTHTYGGAIGLEYGSSLQQTSDGGYIAAGYTSSFGTATDIYLVKTNNLGHIQWTKSIGGAGYDRANSIIETSDGGYMMGGYTGSFGAGGHDALLVKIDINGTVLWSKAYGTAGAERVYAVKQTNDGGFILSGLTSSNGGDIYLIKTDSAGMVNWSKSFGGANNDWAWDVIQANDGGYVTIRGSANFGAGNGDIYMVKTDSMGNSGCNGIDFATTENSQLFVSSNTATLMAGGGDIININPGIQYGGSVSTLCTTMGLEADPQPEIKLNLYPNPFIHSLSIEIQSGEEFENAELRIIDIHGREVQRITNIFTTSIEIKRNHLPSGIYYYSINQKGMRMAAGKLIAQ